MTKKQIKIRLTAAGLAGLILAAMVTLLILPTANSHSNQLAHTNPPPIKFDPFANLNLSAEAVAVLDIRENDWLYVKNQTTSLPIASITKIVTALTARQLLDPDQLVVIGRPAVLVDDITGGLTSGSRWPAQALIDLALVTSSNRAAQALAVAATTEQIDFIEAMNQTVQAIGLNNTFLINPTGLDIVGRFGGSYSTAEDIAQLMSYVIKNQTDLMRPTIFPDIVITSPAGGRLAAQNTNQQTGKIPGILASKTGYTGMAGGNLTVAFDAGLNRPIVVVVLNSNRDDRFADVNQLVKASLELLNQE